MLVQKQLTKIPVKNFEVHYNKEKDEYYSVETFSFKFPRKLYDNFKESIDKYILNFEKRDKNLGILFTGQKGSGKTLKAKKLCKDSKLPVLIISEPFTGAKFNSFINSIEQEVIIFFDEFEKVYKEDTKQEEMLTLLDGTNSNKKLFLFTTNTNNLNSYLKNRPSRIHYLEEFKGISTDTLYNIIENNLKNKNHSESLLSLVYNLGNVGIDVVESLVFEMNLTGKDAKEVVKTMNITIEDLSYDYVAYIKEGVNRKEYRGTTSYNPLRHEKLQFNKWMDGFDYEQYLTSLKKEVLKDKITLEDSDRNVLIFRPRKKYNPLA